MNETSTEKHMNTTQPDKPRSSDEQARLRALSADQSFIIQAPAGSGKTELLIQRFLVLLTTVEHSDKVLAITFTKKAAGEMRCRIHQALERANLPEPPEKPHEQLTWTLARNVFQHAKKRGWNIKQIASELSIMTIDACCQKLLSLSQPPYQLHTQLGLCLYPKPFYAQTVKQFIRDHCIDNDARFNREFQALLLYQHHDIHRIEQLLVSALMNREKWLRITLETNRQDFQTLFMQAIECVQSNHLQTIHSLWPEEVGRELINALSRIKKFNELIDIKSMIDSLCSTKFSEWKIPQWKQMASLILTQKGDCRGRLTIQQGFAAKNRLKGLTTTQQQQYLDDKSHFMEALTTLAQSKRLMKVLHDCHNLPDVDNPEEEWRYLQPMLSLLPSLAVFFQLQMYEKRLTDFSGINLQLLSALLDENQQQALIYQVYQQYQHCLIDEFQDTSVSQFEILEMAFSTWKDDPHRSITVVGDPMQSIYRFRQAEVSLFRQVQKNGFSNIQLENLHLSKNYRSSETLVNQLNQCFESFMTPEYNTFSQAEAVFQREQSGIFWHQHKDKSSQNKYLCDLIKTIIQKQPNASKCLLVRSRNQLNELLPLFQQYQISYSGVGIEALSQCQAVLDCYHLCCLTFDLFDRRHWVAFLMSPAIAMPLADCEILCADKKQSIWEGICTQSDDLSSAGQLIIDRIRPLLKKYLDSAGRVHYIKTIKQLWQELGHASILASNEEREKCHHFFDLIQTLDSSGQEINATTIQQVLDTYPDSASKAKVGDIQIMTIHKSKGLEFDIVIMPHLEQPVPISEKNLLDWIQVPHQSKWHLLMHAHPRHQHQASSVHHFLRHQDKLAQLAETERLYYVAFTRAKQQLHILNTKADNFPERSPMKNLAPVLSMLQPNGTQPSIEHEDEMETTMNIQTNLSRQVLPPDWRYPQQSLIVEKDQIKSQNHWTQALSIKERIAENLNQPAISDTQWGNCIHRYIEYYLHQPILRLEKETLKFNQIASSIGIHTQNQQFAINRIHQQLITQLKQAKFLWIHEIMHQQLIEQPMIHNEKLHRIDGMRINHEHKHIWIIDFKTHNVNKFIEVGSISQPSVVPENYWQQLYRYAEALHALHPNYSIKIALFYPLINFWQERQVKHEEVSTTV